MTLLVILQQFQDPFKENKKKSRTKFLGGEGARREPVQKITIVTHAFVFECQNNGRL